MFLDLDANATYACDEELQGVIAASLRSLGNPSALHRGGQRARAVVEEARAVVRSLVGAGPHDQVIFTSGATEGNNTVIASAAATAGVLVSSQIEHPCVLGPLRELQKRGRELRLVAPSRDGEVLVSAVEGALSPDVSLVSIMAANNETGVRNDIRAMVRHARSIAPLAHIHTDAAQCIGKGAVSFTNLGVDSLTVSGHKFGGLAGAGALVVREGVVLRPFLHGGGQESKLRGGTENVLGIVSLAAAAARVMKTQEERVLRMRELRDRFEYELSQRIERCEFNGSNVDRLPNTSSVFFEGVRADDLVVALDLEGILVSAGAACSSGKPEPSHVLLAMGQPESRVRSTIRVSFRADQTDADLDRALDGISRAVKRMRAYMEGQDAA
jgi:cysteine desulfurase